METTLEVRWFVQGIPPAAVQHWFNFECSGKLLGKLETREDLYACFQSDRLHDFARFSSQQLIPEAVNLKLRQGNLELKLRQQEFGNHRFSQVKHLHTCEGKVEQWHKFDRQELKDFSLLNGDLPNELDWVSVHKERKQKIEQGVKSELTRLKINRQYWWSVAFEMTQEHSEQKDSCFEKVVKRACQTYAGSELLAINSYGYSQWLLRFSAQAILSKRQLKP